MKSMTYETFCPPPVKIYILDTKGGQKGTKNIDSKINNLQSICPPLSPSRPPLGGKSTDKGDKRGHTPLGVSPLSPSVCWSETYHFHVIKTTFLITKRYFTTQPQIPNMDTYQQRSRGNTMKTYETIEEAMQTKLPAVILSVEDYEHCGEKRQWIKARKARGKNIYRIARYSDGRYSQAV